MPVLGTKKVANRLIGNLFYFTGGLKGGLLLSPPPLPCRPAEGDKDDPGQQPKEVAGAGFLLRIVLGDRFCSGFAAGAVLKCYLCLFCECVGCLPAGVGRAGAAAVGNGDAFDGRQAGG